MNKQNRDIIPAFSLVYYTVYFQSRNIWAEPYFIILIAAEVLLSQALNGFNKQNSCL